MMSVEEKRNSRTQNNQQTILLFTEVLGEERFFFIRTLWFWETTTPAVHTLRKRDWPNIPLRTQSRFTWIVPDTMDTTSMATHCPYDRYESKFLLFFPTPIIKLSRLKNEVFGKTEKIHNFMWIIKWIPYPIHIPPNFSNLNNKLFNAEIEVK